MPRDGRGLFRLRPRGAAGLDAVDFSGDLSCYGGSPTVLSTASQLGATPESAALVPTLSAPAPGWGASSKLSGQAAILWNFLFEKDGKRFASGLPLTGAVWKGVRVYDPRLDSTFPGGSGSQRITNEATWAYSENPALHALAYAFGRYQNGRQVFGVGLPKSAIDIVRFAALANVCDANGWRVSGVIYEPGDRWANLKEILAAGGAEPVFAGGALTLRIRAPLVPLDTIGEADLADETADVTAMQSYRDRLNIVIPKYRSPEHNWELIAGSPVRREDLITEDGEEKAEEIAWGLVRYGDQAAQLAAYRLLDGRELGPITLTCLPRLRAYRPGECLHLNLPKLGLNTDGVILSRSIDPLTMRVKLTLIGEAPAKHDFALGRTATPPPTPALGQNAEQRDVLAWERDAWWNVGDRPAQEIIDAVDGIGGMVPVTAELSRPTPTLYAYADGGVVDWLPASGKLSVRRGNEDITADATLSTTYSAG